MGHKERVKGIPEIYHLRPFIIVNFPVQIANFLVLFSRHFHSFTVPFKSPFIQLPIPNQICVWESHFGIRWLRKVSGN